MYTAVGKAIWKPTESVNLKWPNGFPLSDDALDMHGLSQKHAEGWKTQAVML